LASACPDAKCARWQRYPHFAAIALAGAASTARGTRLGDALVRLAGLAMLISGLIGAFHAGVEYWLVGRVDRLFLVQPRQ